MEWFLEKHREQDETTSQKELKNVGYYALIGVFGLFITGWAVNYVQVPSTIALSSVDAVLYGILMAVSEEVFFRGFITDFLLSYFGRPSAKIGGFALNNAYVALGASAGIFAIYHFARYGATPNALIYVWVGGFVLSWIAWKSKRLSPSIVAHCLNNIFSLLRVV